VRHLRAGRVVGIFPEGGLRRGEASVLAGGRMKEGVARLAQIARVPVLPCVVAGGEKFSRWQNWLPLRRTRWAVAYGEPIAAGGDELPRALIALHEEVRGHV
jgi:1-acyl-sn-glycerol-3-phosphate acyltransferase